MAILGDEPNLFPESLLEASRLDGAGFGMQARRVLLPLIRPTIQLSALFAALEREKFGRGQGEDTGRYTTCSLLMIDDLGSEFVSPFVLSALFTVLNTRIINGLRMVLSTNFTLAELEQVYTQKILSRIMGEFEVLRDHPRIRWVHAMTAGAGGKPASVS